MLIAFIDTLMRVIKIMEKVIFKKSKKESKTKIWKFFE